MVSTVLTERRHSQGFIVSESPGEFSRGQVTILQQSSNFQSSSSPILPVVSTRSIARRAPNPSGCGAVT